jgi:hypothetical protein
MRLVLFQGLLLGTAYLVTITPWWVQAWISVFWLVFWVGAMRRAWMETLEQAQAGATSQHLMKDIDDTTPPVVLGFVTPFVGYGVFAVLSTVLLTSLLWFTWS